MKIKYLIFILILSWIGHTATAQQKIELDTQFTELELTGNLRVELCQADSVCKTYIAVYGIDAQRLKWKSKGERFSISLPAGVVEGDCYADVTIYCRNLKQLTLSGVSLATIDTLISSNLTIAATSSINALNMDVSAEELVINASGNCNMALRGMAKWATVNATLGARVDCGKAEFTDCVVKAGQNAEVIVNVSDHLDATASAKASVYYFGSPALKLKTTLGGGVTPVVLPKTR